ncbi:MAG: hypothetical protein ABI377_02725, partial [Devosia sp.]
MTPNLVAIWRTGFFRAAAVGIVVMIADVVVRLLGSNLDRIVDALGATLHDLMVVVAIVLVLTVLSPAIARAWAATANARAAVVKVGAKVPWPWVAFAIGAVYFFLPLIATFEFSLRIQRTGYSFLAYQNVFQTPVFQQTFVFSLVVGIAAIVVGLLLVVPAAYFVRLRAPQLRPIIEFVTLLPLIIPPIILVFGYIRLYNSSSILPMTNSDIGTNILLTLAYVALAL